MPQNPPKFSKRPEPPPRTYASSYVYPEEWGDGEWGAAYGEYGDGYYSNPVVGGFIKKRPKSNRAINLARKDFDRLFRDNNMIDLEDLAEFCTEATWHSYKQKGKGSLNGYYAYELVLHSGMMLTIIVDSDIPYIRLRDISLATRPSVAEFLYQEYNDELDYVEGKKKTIKSEQRGSIMTGKFIRTLAEMTRVELALIEKDAERQRGRITDA